MNMTFHDIVVGRNLKYPDKYYITYIVNVNGVEYARYYDVDEEVYLEKCLVLQDNLLNYLYDIELDSELEGGYLA